ncbi:hypothetical protein GW17_00027992 [Ensete ventricosum]|nr:hypothetical protein GW17_00027992 [Ensete ventricosum]
MASWSGARTPPGLLVGGFPSRTASYREGSTSTAHGLGTTSRDPVRPRLHSSSSPPAEKPPHRRRKNVPYSPENLLLLVLGGGPRPLTSVFAFLARE